MRNWNLSIASSKSMPREFLSYLWGIEIWSLTCRNGAWCPGSYRTYEELKWWLRTHASGYVRVLIVPMRNWNWFVAKTRMDHGHVLIVPMRNWNSVSKDNTLLTRAVLIVPMRNWNARKEIEKEIGYRSSYRTYEELKLFFLWNMQQLG